MKKKDRNAIKETDAAELKKQAAELRRKLQELALGRHTKPSKNVKERKNLRYKLALVMTELRQKELEHGQQQN
jgi:ribosomal protein L29